MRIAGTVAEWETWTGMRFPESGDYVFPAGLAPLHVDTKRDIGEYWEPNVWLLHAPPHNRPSSPSRSCGCPHSVIPRIVYSGWRAVMVMNPTQLER
jgi:hypothetical protein